MALVVGILVCAGAVGAYLCMHGSREPVPAGNTGAPNGRYNPPRRSALFDMNQAIADALGIAPEQLRQELSSGKTIEGLAREKGMSDKQLEDRVLADVQKKLSQAVKDGKITQERADQMYQRLKEGISTGRWLQWPRPQTP